MKKILILTAITMLAACSSMGGNRKPGAIGENSSAELIYNILNVQEHDPIRTENGVPPGVGANTLAKSIGGLQCHKVTPTVPNPIPQHTCTVSTPLNAEKIYNAMNVPEVEVRDGMQKSAGDLSCKMSKSRMNKILYQCSLTI